MHGPKIDVERHLELLRKIACEACSTMSRARYRGPAVGGGAAVLLSVEMIAHGMNRNALVAVRVMLTGICQCRFHRLSGLAASLGLLGCAGSRRRAPVVCSVDLACLLETLYTMGMSSREIVPYGLPVVDDWGLSLLSG